MQQFVVPQFIEVEDKIFGPVTVRQFLILLTAGLLIFVAYRLFDLVLFAIVTAILGLIALLFAFYKPNGQLFHYFLLNVFETKIRRPSIRIWRKDYPPKELDYLRKLGEDMKIAEVESRKAVKRKHIRDLALVVNTGGYYRIDE
jgi:hypothetical protein